MAIRKTRTQAPSPKLRERAEEIAGRLALAIPHPHVELRFEDPWQLLIATILAAQSTDRTVNTVMPELLRRWPDPDSLAAAPQEEVEEVVKSTGFFRNKARAIRETSRALVEQFGGQVPDTMAQLQQLPGVARKTANVVLGAALGVTSGIVVDVHGVRVSQRLELTAEKTPEKIETALCALYPREQWIVTGHRFTLHGRYVCTARAPQCESCPLNELCPARQAPARDGWKKRAQAVALQMESRADAFRRVPI
jgi:endonuclease III